MTDTMKHFEQQTSSTLCSFIQNQVPYFKAATDSNLTRLLLRKKKQNKTKQNKTKQTHLGQVFQSVTSFET